MRLRGIFLGIGMELCALAAIMLLPALVDVADGNAEWKVFLISSLATFFIGGLIVLTTYSNDSIDFGRKEGFAFTTISWITVTAFAAFPLFGVGLDYTDAFFEAMSGLTTTGSTVLSHLDQLPRGLLLWRAELQGLGGIGIVVTAIIILPFLRIGGMQLFHSESSDRSEKIVPRAEQLVIASAWIYGGLIMACAAVYALLGMTVFDAVCHALTTVSTGGFSTHNDSIGFFFSAPIELAAMFFMLAGALPFVLLIRAARGEPSVIWTDTQARGFIALVFGASVVFAIWHMEIKQMGFFESLLTTSFNVVSIITTTGFVNENYMVWSPFAIGFVFLLTFVGGCSGSTSGGIKIYRFQVAAMLIRTHFTQLVSPHRVVAQNYNGKHLSEDVPFSVVAFLVIYMATVGIFTLFLAGLGLDLVTALSSSATAISNVGPGLGNIVGPAGNFATLPDAAKWALSFAMLLGRLELFTVLVMLRPGFWV